MLLLEVLEYGIGVDLLETENGACVTVVVSGRGRGVDDEVTEGSTHTAATNGSVKDALSVLGREMALTLGGTVGFGQNVPGYNGDSCVSVVVVVVVVVVCGRLTRRANRTELQAVDPGRGRRRVTPRTLVVPPTLGRFLLVPPLWFGPKVGHGGSVLQRGREGGLRGRGDGLAWLGGAYSFIRQTDSSIDRAVGYEERQPPPP